MCEGKPEPSGQKTRINYKAISTSSAKPKGANRVLFFGAENGHAQMAKNRNGCLFRALFLWLLSFGVAKESDKKLNKKG